MSLIEANALGALANSLTHVPWETAGLLEAAREAPHINVGYRNREVVEGDAALNVAFWRVFALLNPLSMRRQDRDFATYYGKLRFKLSSEFHISLDEASGPAKALARYLDVEVKRVTRNRQRAAIKDRDKRALMDECDGEPYCWYCGGRFSKSAIGSFLTGQTFETRRPHFIDFTAPRGTQGADLRVEVDHLSAFSRGGEDELGNYRLSCGWCNRHKSALSIIHDAPSFPRIVRHPRLGDVFVPVPFWVVRVVGTKRRCDNATCGVAIENEALLIAPYDEEGALVPGNLGVFCGHHDPIADFRLVPNPSTH